MLWRRRRAPGVRAEVLDFWRGKFALLGDKLAETPDSGEAWFWRIEWNILNYLLHRYGGDEKQPRAKADANEKAAADSSETPRHAALAGMPWGSFARMSGEGKKPRASREIGQLLRNESQQRRKEAAEGRAETYRIVFEAYVKYIDPSAKPVEPNPREIQRMLKEIMQWDSEVLEVQQKGKDSADQPPEASTHAKPSQGEPGREEKSA